MPDMLVRDVDVETLEKLRKIAARNGRSLQSEVRLMIGEHVSEMSRSDADLVRSIKKALSGRQHTDSAKLLRRDRAR